MSDGVHQSIGNLTAGTVEIRHDTGLTAVAPEASDSNRLTAVFKNNRRRIASTIDPLKREG
jgi:hypothetical protein